MSSNRNRSRSQASIPRFQDISIQPWNSYTSFQQLENEIKSRVPIYQHHHFKNLESAISEYHGGCNVFEILIPEIKKLAEGFQENCWVLRTDDTLEITRQDIARILANGFFCNLTDACSSLNFIHLYYNDNYKGRSEVKIEKLKCLLEYFQNAIEDINATQVQGTADAKVTYKRVRVSEKNCIWLNETTMGTFKFDKDKSMLDCDPDMALVDFANKKVGGGVLENGSLQEEIKFITCPELLVALIFEEMQDTEAIIITGAVPYSKHAGYMDTFKFVGKMSREEQKNKSESLIAIDALDFSRSDPRYQYNKAAVEREILKAYAGFSHCSNKIIATGNWGGGAFKGDPELKMCIQWLAASLANKELVYYSYGNQKLCNLYLEVFNFLNDHTIRDFYDGLIESCNKKCNMVPFDNDSSILAIWKSLSSPKIVISLPEEDRLDYSSNDSHLNCQSGSSSIDEVGIDPLWDHQQPW